jgi:isocitrate dehydrogenase
MITNRGIKVWPDGFPETFCTDHWRCRYMITSGSQTVTPKDVLNVLSQLTEAGIDVIKTENLYTFDGQLGFALGQGQ